MRSTPGDLTTLCSSIPKTSIFLALCTSLSSEYPHEQWYTLLSRECLFNAPHSGHSCVVAQFLLTTHTLGLLTSLAFSLPKIDTWTANELLRELDTFYHDDNWTTPTTLTCAPRWLNWLLTQLHLPTNGRHAQTPPTPLATPTTPPKTPATPETINHYMHQIHAILTKRSL